MDIEGYIEKIEECIDMWIDENGRGFRFLELVGMIIDMDNKGCVWYDTSDILHVDVRMGINKNRHVLWSIDRKRGIKECIIT